MKVFLSVGASYNPQQEAFVSAFEAFLGQSGCEKLTVGRGSYYASQPIVAARELMQSADGVVVIAFTRQMVIKALDKPGSDKEEKIANVCYPTVWNQLEAAMAFGMDLPLLVVIERGLKQEAMLKDRAGYRALVTELDPAFFSTDEFKGIFSDWKRVAKTRSSEKPISVSGLTVGRLVNGLGLDQAWKVGSAFFGLIAGTAGIAFWVGQTLGTP